MSSIIRKVAIGLGAAALALGVVAAPASAAPASAASASAASVSGDPGVAQSAGHWQYVATLGSARSCHNRVLQYALEGVEAKCQGSALYIWVDD